jgi:hypothetical protein
MKIKATQTNDPYLQFPPPQKQPSTTDLTTTSEQLNYQPQGQSLPQNNPIITLPPIQVVMDRVQLMN